MDRSVASSALPEQRCTPGPAQRPRSTAVLNSPSPLRAPTTMLCTRICGSRGRSAGFLECQSMGSHKIPSMTKGSTRADSERAVLADRRREHDIRLQQPPPPERGQRGWTPSISDQRMSPQPSAVNAHPACLPRPADKIWDLLRSAGHTLRDPSLRFSLMPPRGHSCRGSPTAWSRRR
jgi:hypothetical protein